jgi:hypothetical protein
VQVLEDLCGNWKKRLGGQENASASVGNFHLEILELKNPILLGLGSFVHKINILLTGIRVKALYHVVLLWQSFSEVVRKILPRIPLVQLGQ